jgi:3-oxoacyl-[acyl-carrier-protein] synthase II
MRRVVITGMGAITSIGNTLEEYWKNLVQGVSGADRITHFDPSGHGSQIACEVKGFDPADHFERGEIKKLDRFIQLAMVAAREAFKNSALDFEQSDPNRAGVIVGCGIGGLETLEEACEVLLTKGARRVSPFVIPKLILNMASGHVSIMVGAKGVNTAVATACATGTHAIGDALKLIQRSAADVMIAGGTEAAITRVGVAGFSNMKALSTRNDDPKHASRPFDKGRDGFVIGEGAGVLVLEEREHALARGAKICAEVIGYGASGDAYHMTAPAPRGEGGARAMTACIEDAGLDLSEIDHINAHGTSTPLNDKLETEAIKSALGEDNARRVAICSNKSMIGHGLGAAGAIEGIAMALTLQEQIIPPTINYEEPDPECDLDYVPNEARRAEVRVALSNSLGFGGHNATIAMRRHDSGDGK